MCEKWVGNWKDCYILTPNSSDLRSTSFLFCWAAQPGVLRAKAFCWELVLSASNCNSNFNWNWPHLTRTLCGTGLYNCSSSTCFLWASHLHRIQPVHGQGYILLSSTKCTCFLIDGWVEGQYVTNFFTGHVGPEGKPCCKAFDQTQASYQSECVFFILTRERFLQGSDGE